MKIVVFDTETTGLDAEKDELLQFSACDYDGNVLLNTYIKPTRAKSWPGAEAVNHISPEMVKDAPTLEAVKDKIRGIMSSADVLVAYNAKFDLGFLAPVFVPEAKQHQIDVMLIFAKFWGAWSDYFQDWKWQTLSTAAAYYGFEFAAHDSMQDVFATLHVLKCMCTDKNRRLAACRISKNDPYNLEADKKYIADIIAGRDPGKGLYDLDILF